MNFLIYSFTGLGNSILFNPCINYLKSEYPNCHITLASYDVDGDLSFYKSNNLVDKTLNFKKLNIFKKLLFINDLFFKKYDYVIYFSFSYPGRLLSFITYSFCRCTILRSKNQINNILNSFRGKIYYFTSICIRCVTNLKKNIIYADNLKINTHEIDHNFDIIKILISDFNNIKLYRKNYLKVNFDKNILKNYNLKENEYLCLQVAGAHGKLTPKVLPIKKLNSVILKLSKLKYKIILLGTKNERKYLDNIITNENTISLIGKTNFLELSTLMNFAFFSICNDSGLLHLADSLRTNVIGLFGPTNLDKNEPLNRSSIIIYNKPLCGGCIKGWNIKGYKYLDEEAALKNCNFCYDSMNKIDENKIVNIIKGINEKKI